MFILKTLGNCLELGCRSLLEFSFSLGKTAMKEILFELCVETSHSALAGQRGGADRIELCAALEIGGLTPGEALTVATVQALSIPVHVLIRSRWGDFTYSAGEITQMRQQIKSVKAAGAAGVALGVLLANGRVDVVRSRELVELARPMNVTFHRAFDETPDLGDALEAVIKTGADCLLTSGGAPNVLMGAQRIAELVEQAGSRIEIMAGGGLRLDSVAEVVSRTGVGRLHGSLIRREAGNGHHAGNGHVAPGQTATIEEDVRFVVGLLRDRALSPVPLTRE